MISLKNTEEHLKNQSLPLSLDNIYTDIQKHIVEPYLVSSMMANDTFVKDWLVHNENDSTKIIKYLNTIKNKYKMFSTFLVSDSTMSYYTYNGFVENIKKENPTNKWYFDFKDSQKHHEINLDFNENLANSMMMFINYKIYDSSFQILGATGIALKISYIDDMLKMFRQKHNFIVTFYDKNAKVVLAEKGMRDDRFLLSKDVSKELKDKIISKWESNDLSDSELTDYWRFLVTNVPLLKKVKKMDFYYQKISINPDSIHNIIEERLIRQISSQ